MNEITCNRIAELTVEALERTAFVLSDPVEDDQVSELPAPSYFSSIAYSGPSGGSLILQASEGFVREVASSLLCIEPDEINPDEEGQSALNELANIVGGSVILEMGSEKQEFKIGLPQTIPATKVKSIPQSAPRCHVDSEGELLTVTWLSDIQTNLAA